MRPLRLHGVVRCGVGGVVWCDVVYVGGVVRCGVGDVVWCSAVWCRWCGVV